VILAAFEGKSVETLITAAVSVMSKGHEQSRPKCSFSCAIAARDVDIIYPSLTVYDLLDLALLTMLGLEVIIAIEWRFLTQVVFPLGRSTFGCY
jgi:hypothetical protein